MEDRPATLADLPAIVELRATEDTFWFGAPEHDEAEVRETFDLVEPLAERSRLVIAGGRLVGAAWWWRPTDTTVVVDPRADRVDVIARLLRWLTASGATAAESLDRDEDMLAALAEGGWTYERSQYELLRGSADPAPRSGRPTPLGHGELIAELGADAVTVHRTIYERAGWADVPGHQDRDLDEWAALFFSDTRPRDLQLGAIAGGDLVRGQPEPDLLRRNGPGQPAGRRPRMERARARTRAPRRLGRQDAAGRRDRRGVGRVGAEPSSLAALRRRRLHRGPRVAAVPYACQHLRR